MNNSEQKLNEVNKFVNDSITSLENYKERLEENLEQGLSKEDLEYTKAALKAYRNVSRILKSN
jgi:hypothetical protein